MTESCKPREFDLLKLFFQEPESITENIIIRQPTIEDIILYGEQRFYHMLNIFIGNTTMFRLQLWQAGIDWNKISNYELFCSLVTSLKQEDTSIIFGDIDFKSFSGDWVKTDPDGNTHPVLYSAKHDMCIDEQTYVDMAHYLRTMFNIFPKNEWARGKATKEAMIWEEEENLKLKKDKSYQSHLLPLISACVNHPGFKYKTKELKEIGIFEFMDSVQRLQVYESTSALLKGRFSGFIDTSGINKEEFNFMRNMYANENGDSPKN